MKQRPENSVGKIRVAFVYNHSFFLGGGEKSFHELIRTLDQTNFEPFVFVPAVGEIEHLCLKCGIPVFVAAFPSLKNLMVPHQIRALLCFQKKLKKFGVDIIHANGSRACLYSAAAGLLLRIPVLWHVRETKRDFFLYDGILGALSKKIVCVSKAVALQRFHKQPNRLRKKIEVIYNGVDTKAYRPNRNVRHRIRRDLGVVDEILIGLVGNIIPLKGHDFFLSGLSEAKKYYPDLPVKALFIGRRLDQNYSARIQHFICDAGLENDVMLIDYTSRIADILSGLDIFLLPSRREGFSRSLLEAMSAGLPILATRIEAIKEAVVDGENAILMDYGDEMAMADAIVKMCGNETLRTEMGERNRKKAENQFDLKCHTASIERLYRELVYSHANAS